MRNSELGLRANSYMQIEWSVYLHTTIAKRDIKFHGTRSLCNVCELSSKLWVAVCEPDRRRLRVQCRVFSQGRVRGDGGRRDVQQLVAGLVQ